MLGIVVILALAARFWHPYFGFTRFLQMDAPVAEVMTPVLRGAPIYTYAQDSGYDGHYYGRIASDPTLRDPGLGGAMDNFAYRARRILTPAIAHLLALGDPLRSVWIYSALNLVAWLALAAVWWALLPLGSWHRTTAWLGLLLSVGALHSVRFALADLPALAWFAGGWLAWERRRVVVASLLFAAAVLSRETMLAAVGVVVLLTWRREGFRHALVLGAVSAAPLAAWLTYVGLKLGLQDGGWDNFVLPGWGLAWKWCEAVVGLREEPNGVFALTTPLATIALTAQLVYLGLHRRLTPEWWLGAAFGLMALTLNVSVWEGNPGAAPRVLLPLSFGFWLCVARGPKSWVWSVLGMFAVPAGLICLWWVPVELREVDAGKSHGTRYLVEADKGFFPTERSFRRHWAWSGGAGNVTVKTWPHLSGEQTVELACLARTARPLEISQGDRLLWRGEVGPKTKTILVNGVRFDVGHATLRLKSDAAPLRESGEFGRPLSFAVLRVALP